MENGNVASGEWIDVMRGVDWIEATLQETIYSRLVNADKIPYTDAGVAIIKGDVQKVLTDAAGQGIITEESIVITVPKVSDISTTDRANRVLPDVEFSATLQGAIHKVEIAGVVAV